jgi:hypothetical protein
MYYLATILGNCMKAGISIDWLKQGKMHNIKTGLYYPRCCGICKRNSGAKVNSE